MSQGLHYLLGQERGFTILVYVHKLLDSPSLSRGSRKLGTGGALGTDPPRPVAQDTAALLVLFCHAQLNTLMTCSALLLPRRPRGVSDTDAARSRAGWRRKGKK